MSTQRPSIREVLLDSKIRRIDVHHHYFSTGFDDNHATAKVGWRIPRENIPWTPEVSLRAMEAMKVDFAVLSVPLMPSGSVSEENRATARSSNEFVAKICDAYPDRFGFFATVPFLDDVEGCLEELRYAIDELGAYGIALSSCYGVGPATKYVGHETYHPIWAELNARKAVVFLHGAQVPTSAPFPHDFLGLPVTEAPNETFRAAAHLVVTSNRRIFPDVKIILAHLGGTAPFLAPRVAVLSNYMGCPLSPEEIIADFKTFYYETALSAYETNLLAVENFAQQDHILFGSDFPAVNAEIANWYNTNLENYYKNDNSKLGGILRDNAVKLFLGSETGDNGRV